MSAVIYALWQAGDAAPLIMPGSVPLDSERVRGELTQYLEDDFKPIIDADIDGGTSTPAAIDRERATLGRARSPAGWPGRFFSARRRPFVRLIKVLSSHPSGWAWRCLVTRWAILVQRCNCYRIGRRTCMERARHWYATQASVQKMAREHADRLRSRPEETWEEILRRLRIREQSVRGMMFARVQVGPETSEEIPDEQSVRNLVIVHPSLRHSMGDSNSQAAIFAQTTAEGGTTTAQGRKTALRINRNMVLFIAADARRYEALDEATRHYLAWRDLAGSEEQIRNLDLPPQQAAQARRRLTDADETVSLRIADSYQWLLVPVAAKAASSQIRVEEFRADTTKERLAERAYDRLHSRDQLRTVQGAESIHYDLNEYSIWAKDGHVAVGRLWEMYCQYPFLPRLKDRAVLERGILVVFKQLTWETHGFALATGYNETTGVYVGLALPHEDMPPRLSDSTLLVRPNRARAQRNAELAAIAAERARREAERPAVTSTSAWTESDITYSGGAGGSGSGSESGLLPGGTRTSSGRPGPVTAPGGGASRATQPTRPALRNTRYYGTVRLSPDHSGTDMNRLYQEVIQHLAASEDVDLDITVKISAAKADGFPDTTTRIVSENARTLKFDQSGFEDQ